MSTKTVPIVFAFDMRVLRPAAVAIRSLIEAAQKDTTYHIHIFHPGFNKKIIEAFTYIAEATRHMVIFHAIDNSQLKGLPSGHGSWTEIVYYRFLIPDLLPKYDRAIYSDIDVYFNGDLSALIELDMKGAPIGAVIGEANSPEMKCHNYFPENNSQHVYMSGFLLMDLSMMRDQYITDKIFETARIHSKQLRMYDLDALNLACNNILPLPFEYCVLESIYESENIEDAPEYSWLTSHYSYDELNRARLRPIIIHYAGPLGKPWRRARQPYYYRLALNKVPKRLNKATLRDIRKYWKDRIATWFRN